MFSHHGGDVKQLARHLGGDERDDRGDPSLLSAEMEPGYRVPFGSELGGTEKKRPSKA